MRPKWEELKSSFSLWPPGRQLEHMLKPKLFAGNCQGPPAFSKNLGPRTLRDKGD